jgi:pyruvate dehydrogenase E2 component (dihydrolipoamide acetyltransferase)
VRVFSLPDLGEGLQEAEIVEWHVKPGDAVAADQAMVSVETDKAIVEVPAPYEGRIEKLFAAAGEVVRVGAPLVGFEGAAPDSGTVVGELSEVKVSEVKATPAVRVLAKNLNVDLASVRGSGPQGVITTEDVKQAARGASPATEEPLRGLRRAMARNMTLAHEEVAAVTIMDDADVSDWPQGTPVLARLVRALVAACRAEPGLNAWYETKTAARRVFDEVHIGIAVDTPEGLLVPVLKDVHKIHYEELKGLLKNLIEKARDRTLPPELLRGATITISNYGPIAGRYATPMVVPPAIAILGAGRLAPRPWVMADGSLAARKVLPLSLTFDHRAATGGEAGRFLNALIADLTK